MARLTEVEQLQAKLLTAQIDVENRRKCLQRVVRVLGVFKGNAQEAATAARQALDLLAARKSEFDEGRAAAADIVAMLEQAARAEGAATVWVEAHRLLEESLRAQL